MRHIEFKILNCYLLLIISQVAVIYWFCATWFLKYYVVKGYSCWHHDINWCLRFFYSLKTSCYCIINNVISSIALFRFVSLQERANFFKKDFYVLKLIEYLYWKRFRCLEFLKKTLEIEKILLILCSVSSSENQWF